MGTLIFDANKITSYVLPSLNKIKTEMNNAYSNCDKVKWYLPSSFPYRNTLTDMCTDLNNIKIQISNFKINIEKKIELSNNFDLKNRIKADSLTRQAAQLGTMEVDTDGTQKKLNTGKSDKIDFNKNQIILNLDNEIEKLETEKELLDKKIKDLESKISLQQYGIARARGLYSGHPELEKWKKELDTLKKERDELTNQITQLKQQKDYFIKYLKEQSYINLQSNNDFESFSQINLTSEEATNILNLLLAFDTASPSDNPILTFDLLYGNVSYEEMKIRFDNSTLGQYHTNIDWKLVESACKKGFSVFELCVLNPDLAQHTSSYIYGDLSAADQNLLTNLYRLEYMTEEERKTIMYIYQAQSPEEASEYLNFKEQEINSRIGMYKALEFLETIDVNDPNVGDYIETTLKGLGDGSLNFLEGIDNALGGMDGVISVQQYQAMYIMNGLTSEELASIDFLTDEVKEKLNGLSKNKILGGTYEISSSIGNMLPAMATSAIVSLVATPAAGNLVGTTLMGVSSGGNAAESAYQQGYGYWQSIFYGTLSGSSEATLGYFLGGIPGISKLSKLTGFKGFLANIASEGAEESLQAILDPYLLYLATGTTPEINLYEVLKSGIYGMITAGIMNGGNMVINGININVSNVNNATIEIIYEAEQKGIKIDYSKINDKMYINSLLEQINYQINVSKMSNETFVGFLNNIDIKTYDNMKSSIDLKLNSISNKNPAQLTEIFKNLSSNNIELSNQLLLNKDSEYMTVLTEQLLTPALEYYDAALKFAQSDKAEEFKTYRTHRETHVKEVAEMSIDSALAVSEVYKKSNANVNLYEIYIAGLWHDVGMAAGADNVKGINSNYDKDTKEHNPEVLKETKGGKITRSNHTLNSALAILDNSQYFSETLGIDPNALALCVFAHSKSNSGVTNLTVAEDWVRGIKILNDCYNLYNETYYPGRNKTSFIDLCKNCDIINIDENGNISLKKDALSKLNINSYALRLGDANTTTANVDTIYNQANEVVNKKILPGSGISYEQFLSTFKGDTLSVHKLICEEYNIEYTIGKDKKGEDEVRCVESENELVEITVDGERISLDQFTVGYILGENNLLFKTTNATPTGKVDGRLHEVCIVEDSSIVMPTIFNINERVGEVKSGIPANNGKVIFASFDIIFPEGVTQDVINCYKKASRSDYLHVDGIEYNFYTKDKNGNITKI